MKIECNIENVNDLFLLEVKERVDKAIRREEYKNKIIDILKLDKTSLEYFNGPNNPNSFILAQNLISKIDYLLSEEDE